MKRYPARKPEACDAVVKTSRYIIDVIVDQCLGNSRWVSTYPPIGSPFISRGPRNMRTICAAHGRRKRAENPSFDRCTRKKSIPQRKDDWPWASVTKSRVYVSLRRSGERIARLLLDTKTRGELKRSFGMQISLIGGKRLLNFCILFLLSVLCKFGYTFSQFYVISYKQFKMYSCKYNRSYWVNRQNIYKNIYNNL